MILLEIHLYAQPRHRALRPAYRLALLAFLLAFALWLADLHLCAPLRRLPANPQLHAWWHVLCGVSTSWTFVWVGCVRRGFLRRGRCEAGALALPWALGGRTVLPFVVDGREE